MTTVTVDVDALLTPAQAAREVRKSARTMRRMIANGDVASVSIGRRRYVRLEDLAGLVRIHRVTVNGHPPDRSADRRMERM